MGNRWKRAPYIEQNLRRETRKRTFQEYRVTSGKLVCIYANCTISGMHTNIPMKGGVRLGTPGAPAEAPLPGNVVHLCVPSSWHSRNITGCGPTHTG